MKKEFTLFVTGVAVGALGTYYFINREAKPVDSSLTSDTSNTTSTESVSLDPSEFAKTGVVAFANDGTPYWAFYDPQGKDPQCLGNEGLDGQSDKEARKTLGNDPKSEKDTPNISVHVNGIVTVFCGSN